MQDMEPRPDPPLVAALQQESEAGAIEQNFERMRFGLKQAAAKGVAVAVLPECALQGYGYETAADAWRDGLALGDPLLQRVREEVAGLNIWAVVGFVERDGELLFNTTAAIDSAGTIRATHRKLHLPGLGVDRFVHSGDREPPVVDTPAGRVGMLICADMIFPEATRLVALKGADVVAISACVPDGISIYADALIRVRAYENCAYVVFADMSGPDGHWRYDGRSQIADPSGRVLSEAPHRGPHVITASVDLAEARNKVRERPARGGIPHPYTVDFFGQRRPELYGRIADESAAEPTADLATQGVKI